MPDFRTQMSFYQGSESEFELFETMMDKLGYKVKIVGLPEVVVDVEIKSSSCASHLVDVTTEARDFLQKYLEFKSANIGYITHIRAQRGNNARCTLYDITLIPVKMELK